MRELNVVEFDNVFGAAGETGTGNTSDFLMTMLDHIGSSIIGCATAAMVGGTIGYKHGGDATGIWGLGIIGQVVGFFGGVCIGGLGGLIGGALVPLSYSLPIVKQAIDVLANGQVA